MDEDEEEENQGFDMRDLEGGMVRGSQGCCTTQSKERLSSHAVCFYRTSANLVAWVGWVAWVEWEVLAAERTTTSPTATTTVSREPAADGLCFLTQY